MILIYKGEKQQVFGYYIAALFIAVYACYTKEPVFGTFLIIALSRLILGKEQLTKLDKRFYYALIIIALMYVISYLFYYIKNPTTLFYNEGRYPISRARLFLEQIHSECLLCATLLLSVIRFFRIAFDRNNLFVFCGSKKVDLSDTLLFAGLGYWIAYWILHMCEEYYFVPSVFLSTPAFARMLDHLKQYRFKFFVVGVIILSLLVYKDAKHTFHACKINIEQRINDSNVIHCLNEYSRVNKIQYVIFDSTKSYRVKEICDWGKTCLEIFMQFASKSDDKYVIPVVSELDNIDDNSVIIFHTTGQERERLLSNTKMKNFHLKHRIGPIEIYVPNSLKI